MKSKVTIGLRALKNLDRIKMNSNIFLTAGLTGLTIFMALVIQDQKNLTMALVWLIVGFVIYLAYLIIFSGPLFSLRGGIIFYLIIIFCGVEAYILFDKLITITCFVAFVSGFSSAAFMFWQYQLRNLNIKKADQSDHYNEEIQFINRIKQLLFLKITKKK